jgi:quinohemoprotein ethanol dehydrogenase
MAFSGRLITGLLLAPLAIGTLVLSSCGQIKSPDADASNWVTHNGSDDESAFSRLTSISTETVSRLGLAWSLDLPGEQTLEATPIAVDGILYFTGGTAAVYAVDGITGKQLWRFDPEVSKYLPQKQRLGLPVNRGAVWSNGKVYVGTIDGRLIAIDAKTGKQVWSVVTVTPDSKNFITGAPRAFKGKILIGNGGADWNARGYVTAYDAETGKLAWRFYTVPGDPAADGDDPAMKMAAKTWSPDHWKSAGGGGTAWDSMTYDAELNQVYIGVGNAGPYNPRVRSPGEGDNLFTASIVALNPDTGKYIWHYQVNPRDAWDYKATTNMVATTMTIGGAPRKVLLQAPTNGFFYVIDRTNGKLLSAEKLGRVTWASHIDMKTGRPVEAAKIRYENGTSDIYPGPFGAHNWQPMSFNPKAGLVYIPYMEMGARYSELRSGGSGAGAKGVPLGGVSITAIQKGPDDVSGWLLAWDPKVQKVRWKVRHVAFWNGGTMTTAGGLVFQGDGDGNFTAYDAAIGKSLWTFKAGLGIIGAPISYAVGGKQYVSVLVGYGGPALWSNILDRGWKYNAQPRRVLTFSLDAKGKLPPTAAADFTINAVDDPKFVIDKTRLAAGQAVYGNCVGCHGLGLRSMGAPAPDLRESGIALDFTAFKSLLHEGTLAPNGMPKFTELTDTQIRDVQMYIRNGAREVIRNPKAAAEPVGVTRN